MPALGRMAVSCRDDSPDFRASPGTNWVVPTDGAIGRRSFVVPAGSLTRRGVGLALDGRQKTDHV